MQPAANDLTAATVELLQVLIRNQCVNDGTPESGEEIRNVDVVEQVVSVPGVEIERYEPTPGRTSLVARIPGTDPTAPSLCLMGHTDVVPVSVDGWRHDPFGGELIDGEVWGRGAVDMLNLTSSMAVVFRSLAERGFRPAAISSTSRSPTRRPAARTAHAGSPTTIPSRSARRTC